jgi:hypothetical protein
LYSDDGGAKRGEPAGMPDVVYLTKRMSVMVTYNIETELDVANRAQGRILDIIIHEHAYDEGDRTISLRRPPHVSWYNSNDPERIILGLILLWFHLGL